MDQTVKEIKKIIDKIRPYLNNDGGDVEFVRYENGVVYVKMMGACIDCGMLDATLTDGIEALLIESVPEVIAVKAVEE